MRYTVYRTTNTINGKIYVGIHATENPNDNYLGSGILIRSAIKKYGRETFKKEILFDFDTVEEMTLKEAEIVNDTFLVRDDVYNLAKGGAQPLSKYTSGDMAEWGALGAKATKKRLLEDPVFREAWSKSMSKAQQRSYQEGRRKRIFIPFFLGRKHSDDSKAKISARNRSLVGERNSQYNTAWVCKINEIPRKVPQGQLASWQEQGWTRGRRLRGPKLPRKPRTGEDSPSSKLTKEQVNEIRKLHATGQYRQIDLSERFVVRCATISHIINNKTWLTNLDSSNG